MHTVTGASLRLLLATFAGTLLLLGIAGGAQASTYTNVQDATAGDQIALTDAVTLTVGDASTNGDTTTLTGASVDFDGIAGSGVTGELTGDTLTLTGGDFAVPESLSTKVHTIDPADPMVVTFADGETSDVAGGLTSTDAEAPAAPVAALQAFAVDGDVNGDGTDDVTPVIPPAPSGERFRISLLFAGVSGFPVENRNSWLVQVFSIRNGEPNEVQVLGGRIYNNTFQGKPRWRYFFDFNYPTVIKGQPVTIGGRLEGDNIFQPGAITGLSGAITGEIELANGVYFTGGSVTWDANGFSLAGGARVDCQEGSVSGQLAGTIEDDANWSLSLTGGTNNGCLVSEDLNLPSGDLTGEIESVDGDITGLFEVGGIIQTSLLPAGVDEWDARFRFIYDGTDAGSYVGFYASAGIGTAQGKVNFDGTFGLAADFSIPFGGSNVAFDGDINRTTPNGPVTYDVGGSANITIGSKGSLAGSVRLTNSSLAFSGDVTLTCPVSGSITGGVATTVPLSGGNDWSVGISGGAPSGCGVTKEFGLGAGTGITGTVSSVGGVVSVNAAANATITTTLIPTKTSFSAGFSFTASQGVYSVAVNASTQGAGFSANVASNGTFGLSFTLSDLALGGVTLGASGSVTRTTPNGAVAYTISGSLAGQAKIYDNLYLRGGSLSISNTGGLQFSGTVRQICTTGYLDATASGSITDSRNWSFDAEGLASSCTIGRAGKFDGRTFYADIDSVNNKVTYDAGVSATRINLFSTSFFLIGKTTTWLTNVTGSITNTCAGCADDGRMRLSFRGTGNAQFKLLWFPTTVAATVDGSFDIRGTSVRRVDIAITKINWNFLTWSTQVALIGALECDVEKGFTTA